MMQTCDDDGPRQPHPIRHYSDRSDEQWAEDERQAAIERIVEVRVARRAQREAVFWRLRLMMIETALLAALTIVVGLLLKLPLDFVAQSIGWVCFIFIAVGTVVTGLSASVGLLILAFDRDGRP